MINNNAFRLLQLYWPYTTHVNDDFGPLAPPKQDLNYYSDLGFTHAVHYETYLKL